jgi:hypothetical protein
VLKKERRGRERKSCVRGVHERVREREMNYQLSKSVVSYVMLSKFISFQFLDQGNDNSKSNTIMPPVITF